MLLFELCMRSTGAGTVSLWNIFSMKCCGHLGSAVYPTHAGDPSQFAMSTTIHGPRACARGSASLAHGRTHTATKL